MSEPLDLDGLAVTVAATAPDADGALRWERDGAPRCALVRRVGPNEWHVRADERSLRVWVARAAEGLWVSWDGRTRLVRTAAAAPPARRGRRGGPAGAAGDLVTPPTPATVVKVLVAPGAEVAAGAPLVVVSAMKMETTLTAPWAATVVAVRTAPGAKVAPGDELVELAPAAPADDGPDAGGSER
jgi:biotin carboxyl carrier protein